MANNKVGAMDTRATNQVCSKNSRQANGGLNIRTRVSSDIAKKSPRERTGFQKAVSDEIKAAPRSDRPSFAELHFVRRRTAARLHGVGE
jgi:hypothetical protein